LAAAPRPSTFRRPYPRDWLGDALTPFALDGPAPLADTLLARALDTRPGWASLYELEGVVALRLGRCAEAAERFLTLLDFGLERPDGPALEIGRASWRERAGLSVWAGALRSE